MNEINLCLLLMDSLDTAYRRESYLGPERLADWGQAVVSLMRRTFPDQKKPQEEVWNIARRVLWDLACAHSADEISRHFLLRPEAFFRSIVTLYVHGPLGANSLLYDPSTLH
jgi:hypothetical protein